MSALDGFEAMEPEQVKKHRRTKWNCGETIAAFLATGNPAMGKCFDDYRTMIKAYMSFTKYVERHGEPVEVHRRGNTVILIRKDEA